MRKTQKRSKIDLLDFSVTKKEISGRSSTSGRAVKPAGIPTLPDLTFTIPGPPVGKQRTRSGIHSAKHHTPKKTRDYEKYIASCALAALCRVGIVHLSIYPTSKQVYLDLKIYHANARKPDSDNVVKAIADGLTGVLWRDDRHVLPRVNGEFWPDPFPRVEVKISSTDWEIKP